METPVRYSFFDFNVTDLNGQPVSLNTWRGQVILAVNTASFCAFTPQYKGLEILYTRYKEQGFSVLAFPTRNFANQEYGSNAQIQQACDQRFRVSFPVFGLSECRGPHKSEVFQYLTEKRRNGRFFAPVLWNFQKFLIDRNGQLVNWFLPITSPVSGSIRSEIERLL
jgi:glutathione peroxidase